MARSDTVLRRSPLQWASERRAARRLTVLAYHSVREPATFSRHLDHLKETANVVSLDEVVRAWRRDSTLPPRPVLITFDDADRSLVEHGIPLLGARDLTAVAFVVAGLVGTDESFWWDEVAAFVGRGIHPESIPGGTPAEVVRTLKQVPDTERRAVIEELRGAGGGAVLAPGRQLSAGELRELQASGITVGSHSYTHPCLDMCSDDTLDSELRRSRESLAEILGAAPTTIAYPNGNHDDRVIAAARRARYEVGFLFDHRVGPLTPPDPMAISRVRVNSDTDIDRFATIVSGLHPAIHRARGRS